MQWVLKLGGQEITLKIESLNPMAGQTLSPGKTASSVNLSVSSHISQLTSNNDNLNLSINFPLAEKSLSNLLSNLIRILNEPAPPNSSLGAIHELPLKLGSLFYKGEDPLSFLKLFIERSGLFYEAKIAREDMQGAEDDLKGIILKIIDKFGEGSEIGKTARVLFNDIEERQLLNVKGKEEGVFYLQIPVLLPQGASAAEVYVRRDGKEKSGYSGDSYRLVFSIELREAGHLSIDATVNRTVASMRLQCENAEFLEFMRHHMSVLVERLTGYGFKVLI